VVFGVLAILMRSPEAVVRLAIVNEDTGVDLGTVRVVAGRALTDALVSVTSFQVQEMNRADALEAVRQRTVRAVIIAGQDFSRALLTDRRMHLDVILEGSNPGDKALVPATLSAAMGTVLQRLGGPFAQSIPTPDIQTTFLYGGPTYDDLDLFAPIYLPFFIFFLIFLLTVVSFLRERQQGTMERLMATPASRLDIVLGYLLGFGVLALVQSIVVLLFSIYVIGIEYKGSLIATFTVEAVMTMMAVGMGIFFSIFARNEFQAIQFIPLVIVPQGLLSGILWQIQDMPRWLQPIAWAMPLTYAIRAMRGVMLRGYTLVDVSGDLAILIGVAIFFIVLGVLTLRREVA
jgi:ABC-2 type transport system permease protein